MKSIVVGYDGSAAARAALDWVANRLTQQNARVELVTVTNTSGRSSEDTLAEAAADLRSRAPGTEVTTRVLDGSMPRALLDAAQGASLLVVGVHQAHPLRTAITGWLPLRIGARSRGPAVIVPEGWVPNEHPVVVGVDDDTSSDAALTYAAAEATASGVPLRMVHGWVMPTPTIEGSIALLASPIEVKEDHRRILADAAERVAVAYPELGIEEVLVPAAPGDALLERAAQSSLLVLGTHHHGVVSSGLFGSVAQDVLWQSSCPVCVVPNAE